MSTIVEHNGLLKLYSKGADTTLLPLLSKGNSPFKDFIDEQSSEMSKRGLRCLYYTIRILPMEIKNRIPVEAEEVEKDLTLLGLTGI